MARPRIRDLRVRSAARDPPCWEPRSSCDSRTLPNSAPRMTISSWSDWTIIAFAGGLALPNSRRSCGCSRSLWPHQHLAALGRHPDPSLLCASVRRRMAVRPPSPIFPAATSSAIWRRRSSRRPMLEPEPDRLSVVAMGPSLPVGAALALTSTATTRPPPNSPRMSISNLPSPDARGSGEAETASRRVRPSVAKPRTYRAIGRAVAVADDRVDVEAQDRCHEGRIDPTSASKRSVSAGWLIDSATAARRMLP